MEWEQDLFDDYQKGMNKAENSSLFVPKDYFKQSIEARRSICAERVCKYGIGYLDQALGGIHKNELVVIGAWSGIGKTTLVEHIVAENSSKGKRVAFFRLEGDKEEFAHIQTWKRIVELHYLEKDRPWIDNFEYKHYRNNNIKGIEHLEKTAVKELEKKYENLYLFDKRNVVNINTVTRYMEQLKESKIDLAIIDHLQYFDILDDKNENSQITAIVKAIKEATERYGIPVVLVSHLRKKDNPKSIVPSMEDFMGSSNIFKIAYTTIALAGDYANYDNEEHKYPTMFRVTKSRVGERDNKIGIVVFDGIKKGYNKDFATAILKQNGERYEICG